MEWCLCSSRSRNGWLQLTCPVKWGSAAATISQAVPQSELTGTAHQSPELLKNILLSNRLFCLMNNGVDFIKWSWPQWVEILRVPAWGESTAGGKKTQKLDSVLKWYLNCFSSRPLSLPLFFLHPVTEVGLTVMVTHFDTHIWDSNLQKGLLFHQQCWVGFFPPHDAWLQLSHPGKHLPRQILLVTLKGFPSVQSVVSKSCFRHLS